MSARVHVCIVGAGILGLSCAYAISKSPQYAVTVIDKEHPGAGSTGSAVGMVVRLGDSLVLQAIYQRTFQIWDELADTGGLTLRKTGYFGIARSGAELEHLSTLASMQRDLGWRPAEIVGTADLARLVPEYAPPDDVVGGLWDPLAMYVDGNEACSLLTGILRDRGVEVRTRTQIQGLQRTSASTKYSVLTSGGPIAADIVVNAAGPWGRVVGEILGAPVGVVNERHHAFVFRMPPAERPVPMHVASMPGMSDEEGLYFRGEGTDRIVAGLHATRMLGEPVGDLDAPARRPSEAEVETVFGLLANALPDVDLGFESSWSGLYPHHELNRFVVGPHPDCDDIFFGAGLAGRGLGPGLALGEILAEWVTAGGPVRVPGAVALRM